MKTHMKSHLKRKVKCFDCCKQYASDMILNEHVSTKHEGKSKSQYEDCDIYQSKRIGTLHETFG
jgi:hypothetical protein